MAGSTLGPAGAALGTGHSSLAGYNNNSGGGVATPSAAAAAAAAANNSNASNGALAARGRSSCFSSFWSPSKFLIPQSKCSMNNLVLPSFTGFYLVLLGFT